MQDEQPKYDWLTTTQLRRIPPPSEPVESPAPRMVEERPASAKKPRTPNPQNLNFTVTDAIKDMVTHNAINVAQCYFWLYKEDDHPAEIPGILIFATEGDTINVTLTNHLDEPHAWAIPGVAESGPVEPGGTVYFSFTAPKAGTYLYYDNLNEPVNRMMGLHGPMLVMPAEPRPGHRFTPYADPTPAVQRLFDDFGTAPHFPGLAWEEGDPATDTPAFRQHVWVLHEASSRLFAEVGRLRPGDDYPADEFVDILLNDPFRVNGLNRKAEFFTVAGQAGHFSHDNPYITAMNRVGEPTLLRVLNAGLWTHSLHIHANHPYVTQVDGVPQENVLWVDAFTIRPMGSFDYMVPYTRPPDVPNERGIGLPDRPLISVANPDLTGSRPHPVWPPVEEMAMFFPPEGTKAGDVDISLQMSPLCYPMHDHSEATQVAQGGNYPMGMLCGLNFSGDRNTAGGVTDFPNRPEDHGPDSTGPAAGPEMFH